MEKFLRCVPLVVEQQTKEPRKPSRGMLSRKGSKRWLVATHQYWMVFYLCTKSETKIQWKEIFYSCYETDYKRLTWIFQKNTVSSLQQMHLKSSLLFEAVFRSSQWNLSCLSDVQNRKAVELKKERLTVILTFLSLSLISKNIKTVWLMLCSIVSQSYQG